MMRITLRTILSTSAIFLCSTVLAREGILKTTTGVTYRGDIREQDDKFIVTVGKIETPIDKSIVTSIDYTGTIDEQFDQKMTALDPKDAQGRVAVARFAFEHGRNDLAIQALSSAIQIDPKNPDALEMLRTVNAQQQLNQAKTAVPTAADPDRPPGGVATTSQPAHHLLTAADINTIKQLELRPGETEPFSITPEARRKFVTLTGMSPTTFSGMSTADQLAAILDKGTDEIKMATKITRDPQALADFKRFIYPAVLRNCATIGCHGGTSAGALVLYPGTDDETVYTNFYILEQYSQAQKGDGSFFGGASKRRLIDRGNGAHSLLVNYALPAKEGEVAHPSLPSGVINNLFHNRSGTLYDQFVGWMDHGMNLIEPTYGIKYEIPHGTVPATQPMTPNQ